MIQHSASSETHTNDPLISSQNSTSESLRPYIVNPVLIGHSKKKTKNWFLHKLSLNAGQKYCRMLSILQVFRPVFSYHSYLRPFLSIMSGHLKLHSL